MRGALPRRRALVTGALLLAAVGGIAAASTLRGSGSSSSVRAATQPRSDASGLTLYAPRTGATLAPDDPRQLPRPRPGAYRGRLLFADERCRLRAVDLASAREVAVAGVGTSDACSFWPSANGRYAAVAAASVDADLALVELGSGRVRRGLRVGSSGAGPPAVTGDGRVATCVQGDISAITPQTAHVSTLAIDGSRTREDGCHPVALGDALVRIGASGDVVADDGRTLLRFAHDDDVAGLVASSDGRRLGVIVRSRTGTMVLRVYDGGGRRLGTIPDVGRGDILADASFSDDGRVAATSTPFGWQVSTAAATTIAVGSKRMLGASVAPDGRAVAAIAPDAIVILLPPSLRPVAAIPIVAQRVAWIP
jgi:hypothetical protein